MVAKKERRDRGVRRVIVFLRARRALRSLLRGVCGSTTNGAYCSGRRRRLWNPALVGLSRLRGCQPTNRRDHIVVEDMVVALSEGEPGQVRQAGVGNDDCPW